MSVVMCAEDGEEKGGSVSASASHNSGVQVCAWVCDTEGTAEERREPMLRLLLRLLPLVKLLPHHPHLNPRLTDSEGALSMCV